eukprot:scaffold15231_cov66-Cyclotella_meneghiniana.AAC.23
MNLMLAYFTVALSFVGGIKKVSATYSPVKSTTYPNEPYTGLCVDNNLQGYPAHQRALKDWSLLDNHFTLCKDYCNQHLLPGYVGLSYFELNNELFCWCHFDSAVGLPDVTYDPPSTKISMATGTGPVIYAEGNVFGYESCWAFTFTPTYSPTASLVPSDSPTTTLKPTILTPAPYPDSGYGIKDFTR